MTPTLSPAVDTSTHAAEAALRALLAGNYQHTVEGGDTLSQLLREVLQHFATRGKEELRETVALSVEASETAILSARMLSALRKVDTQSQSIAAAAEEMVATVQSIGSYGENISRQAQDAAGAAQS